MASSLRQIAGLLSAPGDAVHNADQAHLARALL